MMYFRIVFVHTFLFHRIEIQDTNKVYYDRIPFKLDDFISHLLTDSQLFLSHYQDISWFKMGIKLEDVNSYASDRKNSLKFRFFNILTLLMAKWVDMQADKSRFERMSMRNHST